MVDEEEELERLRKILERTSKQGRGFHNDPNGDRAAAIAKTWRRLPRGDK